MARQRLVNGDLVVLAPDEELERDNEEAAAPAERLAEKDRIAANAADVAIGKTMVRLLWDIESRLRSAGLPDSAFAPIRTATSEAEYRLAVVTHIRTLL